MFGNTFIGSIVVKGVGVFIEGLVISKNSLMILKFNDMNFVYIDYEIEDDIFDGVYFN